MKIIILFLLAISCLCSETFATSIVILDMRIRNGDNNANLYSAQHALSAAGTPFTVTADLSTALTADIILLSSSIETFTFTSIEETQLNTYVSNGGILIACNLKQPTLYPLFGVNNYSYRETRFTYIWDTTSTRSEFRWFNHASELKFQLGDSTQHPIIIGTRGYTLNNADQMAHFEDGSVAATRVNVGNGYTYMLGIAWRDIFLRNQINKDYNASYAYSNTFEPGTDMFVLYLKEIIRKHVRNSVLKHTSTENSIATFIITHDVDAATSMNLMNDYATYEQANNIQASYMMTTHYIDDALAGDYYSNNIDNIRMVGEKGHDVQSHSVGHFPDFDTESIVPPGGPVNVSDYSPYYSSHAMQTYSATIYGEAYVSKKLLEDDCNADVSIFRPGYLAFPNKLIQILASTGYSYSASRSSNDVLSSFPFYAVEEQKMESTLSNIIEMPNLISDVFMEDPITEENYSEKVDQWVNVSTEQLKNRAPVIYMLHPTRNYKIDAQHDLLRRLPEGFCTKTLIEYGEFWRARNNLNYTSSITDSVMTVVISNSALPLNSDLSLIVDKGQQLKEIVIKDESGNILNLLQSNWEDSSVIVHSRSYQEIEINTLPRITFVEEFGFVFYPNPSSEYIYLDLDLEDTNICSAMLYNSLGQPVTELLPETELVRSPYSFKFNVSTLSEGMYIAVLKVGDKRLEAKLVKQ